MGLFLPKFVRKKKGILVMIINSIPIKFSFITTLIFFNSKMQGVAMNKSKDVVQQGNNPIKHANNEFTPLMHKDRTTTL